MYHLTSTSLRINALRAAFLTDETIGKVAPKQTQIKQKKDNIKAARDGGSEKCSYSFNTNYVCIYDQEIYMCIYLPGIVSQPPLPSHKKGSWSLSRGK